MVSTCLDYLERIQLIPYTPRTITDRKRLLEDLDQTRIRGYAINREESLPRVACAAAPIFGHSAEPTASVSISSGQDFLNLDNISELTDELIQTANEIFHSLGFHQNIIAMQR